MNSSAKTGVGTPIYMAPEIIMGGNRYDAKVCHDSDMQAMFSWQSQSSRLPQD
jgi:serine/threonine protein kinase